MRWNDTRRLSRQDRDAARLHLVNVPLDRYFDLTTAAILHGTEVIGID